MKSYDVKFWAIRPGKARTKRTYEVRWKVGHSPQSRTIGNKAQADNFLSELRQAARKTPQGLSCQIGLCRQASSVFRKGKLTLPSGWGLVPEGSGARPGLPGRGHAACGNSARWDHAVVSSYSRPVLTHPCRMPARRPATRRSASSWPVSCARSSS